MAKAVESRAGDDTLMAAENRRIGEYHARMQATPTRGGRLAAACPSSSTLTFWERDLKQVLYFPLLRDDLRTRSLA